MMGSKNDWDVMIKAQNALAEFGIESDMKVLSAHRAGDAVVELVKDARNLGYGTIICGAGLAAHLAGVTAGCTTLPVIGVPLYSKYTGGIDSLLATVQMPKGVPVATVAIDGAGNAGILAAQILAVSDKALAEKLADYKAKMTADVIAQNN